MFQKDLAPHEHQDQAAGQLRPGLAPGAHNGSGLDPNSGEQEGGQADQADRQENVHLEEGEGSCSDR